MNSVLAADVSDLVSLIEDWMTIGDIRDLFDKHGAFRKESIDRMVDAHKKDAIRKILRSRSLRDEDGNPVEFVNIRRTDEETGKVTQVWKQLTLLTEDDLVEVVGDRMLRIDYFRGEIRRYLRFGVKKFGLQFQKRFNFRGYLDDDAA